MAHDLPGEPTLGALVRKILKLVPELKRLRLSSIDSIEADDELLRAIAEEERLMPHFHLSAQAGDDMILKRMKRRHLRADTIAFCEEVRRLRPDVAFGADLIAGFPTETDAMFENTPALVDDAGLSYLHVFPVQPAQRHACRAHAAGGSQAGEGTCRAPSREGRDCAGGTSRIACRHRADIAGGERRPRPHGLFCACAFLGQRREPACFCARAHRGARQPTHLIAERIQ